MRQSVFDVLISYSSKDKTIANALCHYLEERKIRCWIAPRDILPGEQYAETISKAIKRTTIFLLIASEKSVQSQWVRKEANLAVTHNKTIIPFKIEDCSFEGTGMDLYVNDCHWIDAVPSPDAAFGKLYEAVTALLNMQQRRAFDISAEKTDTLQEQPTVNELLKAAEQGHADAQNSLGDCYFFGRGVAKDRNEAIKWYRKAAQQGHRMAQNNLEWIKAPQTPSSNKFHGQEDTAATYRRAAEQGNPEAQNSLGDCYFFGRGVAKDRNEAIKWYRKAARQGHRMAQNNLKWIEEGAV